MPERLSIINLNSDEKTLHALGHEFLPNPSKHFCFLVIGSSGSGKSMMIRNLVERPKFGFSEYYGQGIFIKCETINDLNELLAALLSPCDPVSASRPILWAQMQLATTGLPLDERSLAGQRSSSCTEQTWSSMRSRSCACHRRTPSAAA